MMPIEPPTKKQCVEAAAPLQDFKQQELVSATFAPGDANNPMDSTMDKAAVLKAIGGKYPRILYYRPERSADDEHPPAPSLYPFDPANLRALCQACHQASHRPS